MSLTDYRLLTTDYRRGERGFTLIEVVIASGMLVLVLGAMVHLGRVSVRSHDVSLERSRAYAFAQEGLEIVHAIRDTLAHDQHINQSWQTDVWPASGAVRSPCWVAEHQQWVLVVNDAHCPAIRNGVEERTIQGTVFRRQLTILELAAGDLPPLKDRQQQSVSFADVVRRFRVEVTWESQGDALSVTSETLLTDWQPGF